MYLLLVLNFFSPHMCQHMGRVWGVVTPNFFAQKSKTHQKFLLFTQFLPWHRQFWPTAQVGQILGLSLNRLGGLPWGQRAAAVTRSACFALISVRRVDSPPHRDQLRLVFGRGKSVIFNYAGACNKAPVSPYGWGRLLPDSG